jgi:hypothetical protein
VGSENGGIQLFPLFVVGVNKGKAKGGREGGLVLLLSRLEESRARGSTHSSLIVLLLTDLRTNSKFLVLI